MSSTWAGVLFIVSLIAALALCYRFLGDYMFRAITSAKHLTVERGVYKLIGVNPQAQQRWSVYARSVLAFSAVSIVFLYVFQRFQDKIWQAGTHMTAVAADLAWNTAVSFTTNTNWQAYSGESTMSHVTQMTGLAVQNFVSAAVGIAVAVAVVRGFARARTDQLGNFWVDLTRIVVRILLPASAVAALVLIAGGAVQMLSGTTDCRTGITSRPSVVPLSI